MKIIKKQALLTNLLMLKLEQTLANSFFQNGVSTFVLNEDVEVISRENSLRKLEMCTEFNWNKTNLFFPTFYRIVLRLKTNKISKLSKSYI